ncbi:MAG: hypothetical protein ISS01_00325 [Nanoarchaeota archaeon]|nr:hypothetical protein [Nanoarchaeota archaeon]
MTQAANNNDFAAYKAAETKALKKAYESKNKIGHAFIKKTASYIDDNNDITDLKAYKQGIESTALKTTAQYFLPSVTIDVDALMASDDENDKTTLRVLTDDANKYLGWNKIKEVLDQEDTKISTELHNAIFKNLGSKASESFQGWYLNDLFDQSKGTEHLEKSINYVQASLRAMGKEDIASKTDFINAANNYMNYVMPDSLEKIVKASA